MAEEFRDDPSRFLMHEKQLVRPDGTVIWHAAEPQGKVFGWDAPQQVAGPLVLRCRHLPGGEWHAVACFLQGYPGPASYGLLGAPEGLAEAVRRLEGPPGGETEFVALDFAEAPGDPDELGRAVRDAWVSWASRQPAPKRSWLVPWSDLGEEDRQADREIGEAVAALVGGRYWEQAAGLREAALEQGRREGAERERARMRELLGG